MRVISYTTVGIWNKGEIIIMYRLNKEDQKGVITGFVDDCTLKVWKLSKWRLSRWFQINWVRSRPIMIVFIIALIMMLLSSIPILWILKVNFNITEI